MEPMEPLTIGAQIRTARETMHMSQSDLARRVKSRARRITCSPSTISRIEHDQITDHNVVLLYRILRILELTPATLAPRPTATHPDNCPLAQVCTTRGTVAECQARRQARAQVPPTWAQTVKACATTLHELAQAMAETRHHAAVLLSSLSVALVV